MTSLSEFLLNKKVSIVTGGYGHLGIKISEALRDAGSVVVVAGKDEDKFNKIFGKAKNIYFVKMDISSGDSIKKAFKKIKKDFNHIDILINSAFYSKGASAEKISDNDWNYGLDGALSSVFRCIREVMPYMKKAKAGNIINISSMYGVISPDFSVYKNAPHFFNAPQYGASKAGVIQLTRYYAVYLAKFGIRVNSISFGPFPSYEVQKNKDFADKLAKKTPLGRIGNAEEVKCPVIFLASPASSYVTGHNLIVDGGWTIW